MISAEDPDVEMTDQVKGKISEQKEVLYLGVLEDDQEAST